MSKPVATIDDLANNTNLSSELREALFETIYTIREIRIVKLIAPIYDQQFSFWSDSMTNQMREEQLKKDGEYWSRNYLVSVSTMPALVRMVSKSLRTLLSKTYIVINRKENLNLEINGTIPARVAGRIKELCSTEGLRLIKSFTENEVCKELLSRRDDTEHNIERIFQEQVATLYNEQLTVFERDRYAREQIFQDLKKAKIVSDILDQGYLQLLRDYIK